jgi:hypothetical protein
MTNAYLTAATLLHDGQRERHVTDSLRRLRAAVEGLKAAHTLGDERAELQALSALDLTWRAMPRTWSGT